MLKKFTPNALTIVLIFMTAIGLGIFFLFRWMSIEDYCREAIKTLPVQDICLPPTQAEKLRFPGISCITPEFRNQLKCEAEQKVFFLF